MLHIETERKFLVQGDYKIHASRLYRISQGYLSSVPERTVRVRVRDEKGYLTIKGKGNGVSRVEWETEITQEDAVALLGL
jgi:adenylate cyclase